MSCKAAKQRKVNGGISRTREYANAQHSKSILKMREKKRAWIDLYLKSHPCVDCGKSDPVVLEFDHRDRKDKIADVSVMILQSYSLETLQKEVQKCDVRCANDHRRKHARERKENKW